MSATERTHRCRKRCTPGTTGCACAEKVWRDEMGESGVEWGTVDEWEPCWKCGEPLTPENAPRVDGGIECQSCLTVWATPRYSLEDAGAGLAAAAPEEDG